MNYQLAIVAIVASVTTLAFFAHVFGGIPQSLTAEPAKLVDKARTNNLENPQRHWAQLMCAFQLVTVDLLALSILLFLLAFTEVFVQKQMIGFSLSALYFLRGCSWLVQLLFLKRPAKDYLMLGQWIFWFGCSALVYWGSLVL